MAALAGQGVQGGKERKGKRVRREYELKWLVSASGYGIESAGRLPDLAGVGPVIGEVLDKGAETRTQPCPAFCRLDRRDTHLEGNDHGKKEEAEVATPVGASHARPPSPFFSLRVYPVSARAHAPHRAPGHHDSRVFGVVIFGCTDT